MDVGRHRWTATFLPSAVRYWASLITSGVDTPPSVRLTAALPRPPLRSRCRCLSSSSFPSSPTMPPLPSSLSNPPSTSLSAMMERLTAFTQSTRPGVVPLRSNPPSSSSSTSSPSRPPSPPLSPYTRPSSPSTLSASRRAAVLVGLFPHPTTAEVHVLLTLRSSLLNSHSGEVSLPGGKADEEDEGDDVRTAVREAEEEVGLDRRLVHVIGPMNRVLSKAGLLVTPVVAVIPTPSFLLHPSPLPSSPDDVTPPQQPSQASPSSPSPPSTFTPILNPSEVGVLFSLPLSTFLSSTDYRFQDLVYPSYSYRLHYFTRRTTEWVEVDDAAHSPPLADDVSSASVAVTTAAPSVKGSGGESRELVVWGMTAHVLIAVARVAFNRPPDFELVPFKKTANATTAVTVPQSSTTSPTPSLPFPVTDSRLPPSSSHPPSPTLDSSGVGDRASAVEMKRERERPALSQSNL